ncbi:MAG: MFS transporter [Actinobacteria bacterium]|nr:MFS transporter [Actinomycetota bacterium]
MREENKQPEKNNGIFVAEAEVTAPEPTIIAKTSRAIKSTFHSLKYESFRLLWAGGWFSNVGSWIQNVAIGWLVYELTKSSVSLGIVNFSSTIPVFFLSFYAGAITDRFSKKWIVFWGNFFPMIFAFILGFLVATKNVNIESIVLLSFASGIAMAFAFPAWQSFISEVVPRKDLMNAIALNSVQFHASRLIGPALAGILVSELGLDWAFFINGLSFLAVLGALLAIKVHSFEIKKSRGWVKEVLEGFAYLREKKQIIFYLLIVSLIGVFGISYLGTLMPIFAGNILKVKAKGFGSLMASNGFGGLVGALFVAWIAGRLKPVEVLRFSVPLSGISLIFLGFSRSFMLSFLILFFAGAFFLASNSTLNTAIQNTVEHHFRGRVMSIFVWMFMGLSPFGALLAGFLGKVIGVQFTIVLGGAIILILGLWFLILSEQVL